MKNHFSHSLFFRGFFLVVSIACACCLDGVVTKNSRNECFCTQGRKKEIIAINLNRIFLR